MFSNYIMFIIDSNYKGNAMENNEKKAKKSFVVNNIDADVFKGFKVRCAKEEKTMSSTIKKFIFAYAMGAKD